MSKNYESQKDEREKNQSKREIFRHRMENSITTTAMMMDHVLPGQYLNELSNSKEKKKRQERTSYGEVGIPENSYSENEREKNPYY